MTNEKNDQGFLKGRHPEFARMSRRPGLGVNAMYDVASELLKFRVDEKYDDVPVAIRRGRRALPLGRTLRRKLRSFVGKEENAPQSTLDQAFEDLRPLYEAAETSTSHVKHQRSALRDLNFKNEIISQGDQKVKNIEARNLIFKPKRRL